MQLISSLLIVAAASLPAILAIPTPDSFTPLNTTTATSSLLSETSHLLEARGQKWQCKFSFTNTPCTGSPAPATGAVAVALGTDPDQPFRKDILGQKIGGASPCHRLKNAATPLSSWLTDNTCANGDKSRYDVIAVFDTPDCSSRSARQTQFDIASSWMRAGGKGFCRKVDFTIRSVQLWQWLPTTLPGQLGGTDLE